MSARLNVRLRPLRFALILTLFACGPAPTAVSPPRGIELEVAVRTLIDEHVERVREAPMDARAHATLGLVYEANELWKPAAQSFANASELDNSEPLWELHRAICLGKSGEPEAELALLEAVVTKLDTDPAAHFRLAVALLEDGRVEEAERAFRRAGELAPTNPEPVVGCARALLQLGDAASARELLEPVLAREPRYAGARYALGLALRELGDDERARRELELGLGAEPRFLEDGLTREKQRYAVNSNELIRRGAALIARADFEEAVSLLERAVAQRPKDDSALAYLAWAYVGVREYEKGREFGLRATEINESSRQAHITLAYAHLGLNRFEEALEHADRAVVIAPADARAHFTRARVLHRLKRTDESRAELHKVIEYDEFDLRARVFLGMAELESGLFNESEATLRATLALDSRYMPARTNLVNTLLVLGKFDEARAEIEMIRSASPDHPKLAKLEEALILMEQ